MIWALLLACATKVTVLQQDPELLPLHGQTQLVTASLRKRMLICGERSGRRAARELNKLGLD